MSLQEARADENVIANKAHVRMGDIERLDGEEERTGYLPNYFDMRDVDAGCPSDDDFMHRPGNHSRNCPSCRESSEKLSTSCD